jgi:diketogulonate reductase-like aldo/keto reductase
MTQPTLVLNNGVLVPQLGLGTWQAKDGHEAQQAVSTAIQTGYRLIDTAAAYGNEQSIGRAIEQSLVHASRQELFITTKVWNADQGYDETLTAFDRSLERLNLDYVDLYLIHWPVPAADKYIETWHALEKLYSEGKVRAIGVCNFTIDQLERLRKETTITPAINQIELHPYFTQTELRRYCTQRGIIVEAYSPLGGSGARILNDPVITQIATKHNRTPAQIVLRWHMQLGHMAIPKSTKADHIISNFQVFDFTLTNDEMEHISDLDKDVRIGADPNTANFGWNTKLVQLAHHLGLVHW